MMTNHELLYHQSQIFVLCAYIITSLLHFLTNQSYNQGN